MDPIAQARALGQVEGRAEALEDIANLHAEIAELHGRIEQMVLAREEQMKELVSNLYKDLKATFKLQAEALTPKQVVEICKPCLRRAVENHLGTTTNGTTQEPMSVEKEGKTDSQQQFVDVHPLMDDLPTQANAGNLFSTAATAAEHIGFARSEAKMDRNAELPQENNVEPLNFAMLSHQTVLISGCEKVGTGHGAYIVYIVELHDEGNVLTSVKRRFNDFVWLWERLSMAYPHACIPTLPPKSSLRGQSRFQSAFTEKRKRILQRWIKHIYTHITLGLSTYMHAFLHDSKLPEGGYLPQPSPTESTFPRPFRKRTMSHDKRLDQAFKKLQEPLAPTQKQIIAITKRADTLIKAHQEMSNAIDAMQQHCFQVHAFDWTYEQQSTSPWDAWRTLASHNMRLQHDIAELWEIHVQEPFTFHHDQVLPRIERQVQDLAKDLTPPKLDKICLEWEEIKFVHAKLLIQGFVQAATGFKSRHQHMRAEWSRLKEQLMPDEEEFTESIDPEPANRWQPQASEVTDDAEEARALFGDSDEVEARNLFGMNGASSDSSSDDEETLPPTNWDIYIERMRRKQKSRAEALAEKKIAETSMEMAENSRKQKKRPQSLNWPVKRSTNLRLDERVKQQHQTTTPSIRRSSSSLFDNGSSRELKKSTDEPLPGPLPPQGSRTVSLPTEPVASNWIEVKTTDGRIYYYHKTTRATRWTKPDQSVMESIEERILAQQEATQRRLEERRQWHEEHRQTQEKEAEEAEAYRQEIDSKVEAWAKQKDIVAMLNTLHEIFPYKDMSSCQVSSQDNGASAIKKAYMKAVRQLHPDKLLPSDFPLHQRLLGQHLFSTLTRLCFRIPTMSSHPDNEFRISCCINNNPIHGAIFALSLWRQDRMLGRFLRRTCASYKPNAMKYRLNHTNATQAINFQALRVVNDAIEVTWKDGFTAKFHRAWLRDNCTCPSCQHPTTLQRQILTAEIPLDPTGEAQLDKNDTELSIEWDAHVKGTDCLKSTFTSTWLRDHAYSVPAASYNKHYRQQRNDKKTLWGKDFNLPATSFDYIMGEGFRNGMQMLQEYGVLLIKNTPNSMDETEKFARKIGFVLETIYGGMWTTRPANPELSYKDTASTNLELGPHTDCTYLYEPPGLQIFNCVQQVSREGEGSSRFVDAFHVVEWLRANAPEAYEFFTKTPLNAYCIDTDVNLHVMRPIIQLDWRGNVELVRFNDYDRAPVTHLSFEQVGEYYKHHKTLWKAIRENEVVYKMDLGDMVVVDNHRVFHGRHAFQGERALIGCYIGRSEYDSRLRVLGLL